MRLLLYCKKQPATATCESETDALTDPKIVLHFMETTDVPQSEKTSLLFPHSKEATPIIANPDAESIRPSVDGLCRDGPSKFSCDLRTKRLQTQPKRLGWL